MYRERMNRYYPQVLRAIDEFKAIIDADYPEFESLNNNIESVLDDAYLVTMSESRVEEWERILGIRPIADSTLQDRRDTVIARIRGQGNLNTKVINSIVNAFTGGSANSWIEDSILYIEITPPSENKQFKFENVERELALKVPAHLGFKVSRNYYEWMGIKDNNATWQDVKNNFDTWHDVCLFTPFN